MPKRTKTFTVVVSSPSDMDTERAIVDEVVDELNRTWKGSRNVRLESFLWERDVSAGMGEDPQSVIDDEMPDEYDIYLGLLWKRFGEPTHGYGSGTESEYRDALERWEEDPSSVDIMFYFKDTNLPRDVDPEQLQAVNEFRNEVEEKGITKSFRTPEELRSQLRMDLTKKIDSWNDGADSDGAGVETGPPEPPEDTPGGQEEVREGLVELVEEGIERGKELERIMTEINELVTETGERLDAHAKEAEKLELSSQSDLARAKKTVLLPMASDLNRYASGIEKRLPQYVESGTGMLESWSRSVTLLREDFSVPEKAEVKEAFESLSGTRVALEGLWNGIQEAKSMLAGIPRVSRALAEARSNATSATERLGEETKALAEIARDAESQMRDWMESQEVEPASPPSGEDLNLPTDNPER